VTDWILDFMAETFPLKLNRQFAPKNRQGPKRKGSS